MTLHMSMYFKLRGAAAAPRALCCSKASKKYEYAVL